MKIPYAASTVILDNLEWISELDDIDHEICEIALDAKAEIQRLERIIKRLST